MALEIFKLIGSIMVDNDEANKSIQNTSDKAEGVGNTLMKGVGTAAKWGTALVTGATAATGAVVGMATSAASTADEVDKMSQKIGVSNEGYQEWAYVMGQNGMEIDKMQTGMKTLVSQMDSAASGTSSAVENFEKLGLSIYDSNGNLKDQETMMNEVMYALADMENGTEKARLATELFGKSGTEMMPMLNQGSQAMDDLKNRAHDLGLIMDDETVKAGVTLGDTIDDVKQSFSMMGTSLGATVMPLVQQFADLIIQNIPTIQSVIQQFAPIIGDLMANMLPLLMQLATTLLPIIVDLINQLLPFITQIASSILPIIVQMLQMFLPPLLQIAQMVLPVMAQLMAAIMPLFEALLPLLQPLLDVVVMILEPIVQLVSAVLPPLIEILTQIIEFLVPMLSQQIEVLSTIISSVLGAAFEALMPIIENIMGIFQGLIDFITGVFTGNWQQAWNGVVQIFANIFQGIVNIVKAPLNFIISGINSVFSKIGSIQIPDWVPGIGGSSFSLPQLPMLAEGGDIEGAGRVIVGENAPEILDLPRGARVTPLDKMNGVGKEDIYDAVYGAFSDVLQEVGLQVEIAADPETGKWFKEMRTKGVEWKKMHNGRSAF